MLTESKIWTQEACTTPMIVFSVTYYLELCSAYIYLPYNSYFSNKRQMVVWTL